MASTPLNIEISLLTKHLFKVKHKHLFKVKITTNIPINYYVFIIY